MVHNNLQFGPKLLLTSHCVPIQRRFFSDLQMPVDTFKPYVLIVDDYEMNIFALTLQLEGEGVERIEKASTGEEALETLANNVGDDCFNLVLMDY